jgi:uracil-DNA glycosylase
MVESGADLFASQELPENLDEIAQEIQACRRCPIGCNETRAVAGEGNANPKLMIVGEQPGDVEEQEGRPFVGPAGQLLDHHLARAGIDRREVWMTNAVKHFKFTQRGKRRLHETPTAREIDMCRWWLDAEKKLVQPQLVLALGASAARAMLGKTVSVQRERGQPMILGDGSELWITVHPSFLLRVQDEEMRAVEATKFEADLRAVKARIAELVN